MAKPQGGGGDESSVFGTVQVLGLERWIGRILNGGVEPVLHAEAAVYLLDHQVRWRVFDE